jgi:hypothetical protein
MTTKSYIISFLTIPTYDSSQQYIITLRNIPIPHFSISESRSLWFSLLLYKFRSEFEISDELWQASRTFILNTLKGIESNSAQNYLQLFNEWKIKDYNKFVDEVTHYYIHVLHLKETIEETKSEHTVSEWSKSYQDLLIKIRQKADQMGFLQKLDEKVNQLVQTRNSIVLDTLRKAYWDIIEDDIRHENYTSLLCQLNELKDLMKYIIPKQYQSYLDDQFDIHYIIQRIETKTLDKDYLIQLCEWIIHCIKEWDSEILETVYDREILIFKEQIETLEWVSLIRYSIELCTILAFDTKTRISICKSII